MKKYIYFALASVVAVVASCDLKEEPMSYYEQDTFFTTEAKAKMAVLGAYSDLSNLNHYGQWEMATPSSDDTYYINGTTTDNTRRDISHYTVNPTNTWLTKIWSLKYACINRANDAIIGIEGMPEFESSESLQELDAEARFLRAFLAFDLVKCWGDVPFSTATTTRYEEAFKGRTPREEIYDQMIVDLDYAKEHLYMADAGSSPEVPCKGAAHAMLMRVYLQRAGYSLQQNGTLERPSEELRQTYFKKVIEEWEALEAQGYHGFYDDGFVELFKSFSHGDLCQKESLWEIAFCPTGDSHSVNAGQWGVWNGPLVAQPDAKADKGSVMGRANAFFRVLPAWKGFFEDGDVRRDVMVCTYQYKWKNGAHVKTENKEVKDWYPGKWRREWQPLGYIDPNNNYTNFCPIRYADAVLMAAEAYNETGDHAKAWALINRVRERAGATPVSTANYADIYKAPKVYDLSFIPDGDETGKIRTALYWERGFELSFEGQRKYDLIRWGILAESLQLAEANMDSSLKGKYVAGTNFVKGKHELFPIPLNEIQTNSAITENNPGY